MSLLLYVLLATQPVARIGVAIEHDDNATRARDQNEVRDPLHADGLMRLTLDFAGKSESDALVIDYQMALGGKLYLHQRSEHMAVAQARISAIVPGPVETSISTFVKARGQYSEERTYLQSHTDLLFRWRATDAVLLRGGLAASTFQSVDQPLFSSSTGNLQIGATYLLSGRELLDLSFGSGVRAYPFLQAGRNPLASRLDLPINGAITFRSLRSLLVEMGYSISRNISNTEGEDFTRHAIKASLATRLPGALIVSARGRLQLTQYDKGLSVGQLVTLDIDNESQNSFTLALARNLIGGVAVEARFAAYANEIADEELSFRRTTISIGLRSEL